HTTLFRSQVRAINEPPASNTRPGRVVTRQIGHGRNGSARSDAGTRKTESGGEKIEAGGDVLSHPVARAVPSALRGLTTVFGMGTGVAPAPWPPARTFSMHWQRGCGWSGTPISRGRRAPSRSGNGA